MLPGKAYSPLDFAAMAWRRRWLIIIPMLIMGYAALFVSSRLRDMYTSETLIQVIPQRVPDSYVQSTVTMRTEDRLNPLSQQVLSRTALEGLITQMDLYAEERRTRPLEDVVDIMRDDIKVQTVNSRGANADAFTVKFSYPDRELATQVTERLGNLFIQLNARDRGDMAEATDRFLQSQLADTRRTLEEIEQRLERFREQNAGRLPTQQAFNMQAIQSTQLSIQALVESLARDRDRKAMLERLLEDAQIEPAPVAASRNITDGEPAIAAGQTAAQQLAAAREGLARLELRLRPEHPDIARAKRLIQELEVRAADEAKPAGLASGPGRATVAMTAEQQARQERLRTMRVEIESLSRQITFKEAEEAKQRSQLADYQRRVEQVPGVESAWIVLTRDYETQQAAYRELLMKSEQSKVAVELERRQIGEQFRVLDPARPPVRPTGLRRLQVNAGGLGVGLVVGLLLAAFVEFRDRTFTAGSDVVEVLKLPVLALVPYVATPADNLKARRRRTFALATAGLTVMVSALGVWALELWRYVK